MYIFINNSNIRIYEYFFFIYESEFAEKSAKKNPQKRGLKIL